MVERACVLCSGITITMANLPLEIQDLEECGPVALQHTAEAYLDSTASGTESAEDRIINTLRLTYGNKAQAARILGIDRSTLYRKIKHLNIDLEKLELEETN